MVSRVTLVPAFDVAQFAEAAEIVPRATIIPAFNMEQYARSLVEARSTAGERPDPHASERASTVRPAEAALLAGTFDELSEGGGSEQASASSEDAQFTEALFDAVLARPRLDRAVTATLEHRETFVLLHVDGVSTVRQIVACCGVPRAEVLGILAALLKRKVVCMKRPGADTCPPSSSGARDLAVCLPEYQRAS